MFAPLTAEEIEQLEQPVARRYIKQTRRILNRELPAANN
jgi:hypothetical protein